MQWLRRWIVRTSRAQNVDLSGRHIIVTGASTGSIGFETARTLAEWGAHVAITTRSDPDRAAAQLRERLGGRGEITGYTLDLTDAASVRQFADGFRTRNERLDVLINNAGVHLDLMSEWKQPKLVDGHEIHWRTNYLGTMQLTHALLPLQLQTGERYGEARVVNVVSMLYKRGMNSALFAPPARHNSWSAYGNSKLALVHATFELQRRHAPHLQAYCLHPGAVYTNIASKGLAGHPFIGKLRAALAPVEAFLLMTPEEGAQTSIHCATQPGLEGGRYFKNCAPEGSNTQAADTAAAARLWDETKVWVDAT